MAFKKIVTVIVLVCMWHSYMYTYNPQEAEFVALHTIIGETFLSQEKRPHQYLFIHTNGSESREDAIGTTSKALAQFIKKNNSTLGIRNKDIDTITKNIEITTNLLINTLQSFRKIQLSDDTYSIKNITQVLKALGTIRKTYAAERNRIDKLLKSILITKSSKELLKLLQKFIIDALSFTEKFAYALDKDIAIQEGLLP